MQSWVWTEMGWQVPADQQIMASELGESQHVLRLSYGYSQSDLHDECDWIIEQRYPPCNQEKKNLPNWWFREKGGIFSNYGSKQKMDDAHSELESCHESL